MYGARFPFITRDSIWLVDEGKPSFLVTPPESDEAGGASCRAGHVALTVGSSGPDKISRASSSQMSFEC